MKRNFTVRQGALDGVEAFLAVAQHRSFRKAAAELGVTPSAVSQAIRALEGRLGAALFIRTTRSVGLTESGERFLSRAKPAFEELVAASEVARDLGRRPTGLLRLTVPRAVVPILLKPLIASFCRANPDVEVEIAASAELVDIAARGFDAGIRFGQLIAADMIAVRLTPSFPLAVMGSPEYLRRRGKPERIDDLRQHACLRIRRSNGMIAPWSFVSGNRSVEAIVSGPLIAYDFPTEFGIGTYTLYFSGYGDDWQVLNGILEVTLAKGTSPAGWPTDEIVMTMQRDFSAADLKCECNYEPEITLTRKMKELGMEDVN